MFFRQRAFWLWGALAAFPVAAGVSLDVFLIATGAIPAVRGFIAAAGIPLVVGLGLGAGRRKAATREIATMSVGAAAILYGLLLALTVVAMALSSPISCSQPSAPSNCDNDTGDAVGLSLAIPIALLIGGLIFIGSLIGRSVRRLAGFSTRGSANALVG